MKTSECPDYTLPFKNNPSPKFTLKGYIFLFVIYFLLRPVVNEFALTMTKALFEPHLVNENETLQTVSWVNVPAYSINEFIGRLQCLGGFEYLMHTYAHAFLSAGLREELTFRYFIMRVVCMDSLHLPFWLSLQISAVLFASSHYSHLLEDGFSFASIESVSFQVLRAYIDGLIWGYLYYLTNNIFFLIMIHTIHNGTNDLLDDLMKIDYNSPVIDRCKTFPPTNDA